MTPTVKTYIEKLEELLKMQEKSFVYEMTGEGSGLDWNNEFIPFANKLKDELSFLKQQIEAEEKWQNMTPIERMKAKGLIDMSYKPYEPPDEVDDTLLGLDGEETWLP